MKTHPDSSPKLPISNPKQIELAYQQALAQLQHAKLSAWLLGRQLADPRLVLFESGALQFEYECAAGEQLMTEVSADEH